MVGRGSSPATAFGPVSARTWSTRTVRAVLLGGVGLATGVAALGFEARDLLGFKVGAVGIRPSMTLAEQFNDNITYTSGDVFGFPRKSDFITIVSPGLTAIVGHEETGNVVSVGYRFDAMLYADNDRYNSTDHNVDLSVTLTGNRVLSTTHATAGYASSIYRGYDRFIEGIYLPSGNLDRVPYGFSTRFGYDVTAKTAAYLSARVDGLVFPDNNLFYRDRNDWRITLGGDYALRPKLRLLAETYYGQSSYGTSGLGAAGSDWDRVGGNVGFTSELTERLSGTAKVGYESWDRGGDSGDTVTADVSLGYQLTPRTGLSLNFSRDARESVYSAGRSYVRYRGGLGVQHQLGTKRPVTLAANANATFNDYDSGREDTYYSISVRGIYAFREWLRFVLAYQFDSRDGDLTFTRNYTVNTVTLSITAGY